MRRVFLAYALCALSAAAQNTDLPARATGILEQRCFVCHGTGLAQSGLRLNSRDAALKGGTRGPALVAGNASGSLLVQAIRRTGDLSMPPGPKLADSEIATIGQWVDAGAVWPK